MTERRDRHHLLHDRVSWEARSHSAVVRNNNSLIAHDMLRLDHELLHRETAHIPVPGINTLIYLASNLESSLPALKGIDRYSHLVEESLRNPRTKDVERQLGELSIQAMRAQIPYVKQGQRRFV